jgi:hypothetical protein
MSETAMSVTIEWFGRATFRVAIQPEPMAVRWRAGAMVRL